MSAEEGSSRVGTLSIGLLLLLALVLRIAFVSDYEEHHPFPDRPVIDEAAYERWALEIAGGEWIGDEVFFQEPLYPYWLGSVYAVWGDADERTGAASPRQRTAARYIQAFFGAIAVVLIVLVTQRLFGAKAALVAGVGMATYRPLLYFPALLLKPNLVVPLLAFLVWLLLRTRIDPGSGRRARWLLAWLAAGLVAGLGALLRGNVLLLLPAFLALPFVRARLAGRGFASGLAPLLALAAGMALVLGPVALRNHAVGGVFALTTSGAGTNLYGGNNPDNPYGRATEFDWVRGIPEHEADDWRNEAERRTGRVLDPTEVSSFWLGETLRSVLDHPRFHLRIIWNKLRLSLGTYEIPDNHHIDWDARHLVLLGLPVPGFGLWGWLGLAGILLLLAGKRFGAPVPADRRGAWELLALFVLYLGTIVLTVTSMRIRLALVPLLMPFAGHFTAALFARAPLRAWLPPLVVAGALVHWPVLDREEREDDLAKRDFNHAIYLLERGDLDAAEAIAQELAGRKERRSSRVEMLLADVERRRAIALLEADQRERAEELLRRAMSRLKIVVESPSVSARERFRAQSLAGWIQYAANDWEVAERRFREALRFDPRDRELRLGLANVVYLQALERGGDERIRALVEARAILEELEAEEPNAEIRRRLREVQAELE